VQAVILAIDSKAKRLSLGIKQLQPDAWESFFAAHKVGDVVRGRVSRIASFGVFVELAEGVEGFAIIRRFRATCRARWKSRRWRSRGVRFQDR